MQRNDRFPTLSSLASITKGIGWTLIGIGLICVLVGFIGWVKGVNSGGVTSRVDMWSGSVSRSGSNPVTGALTLAGGVVGAVSGLILLIYAEGIGVAFAIEQNTRGSAQYIGDDMKPRLGTAKTPEPDLRDASPVPASMMRRMDEGDT